MAKWLGRQSYLDDLASLDPELYKGLVQLKNYPGNPEDLSLNFTVAEEEFGVTRSIDLLPGGSDIAVTRVNRMECKSSFNISPWILILPFQISNSSATTSSTGRLPRNVRHSSAVCRILSIRNGCECMIKRNCRP